MSRPKVLFVGDTLLETTNASDPFCQVEEIWNNHDLIILNLENPITETCCPPQTKAATLFVDPTALKWLSRFKHKVVVCFANNHIFDCGESGLEATKKNLNDANIKYCPLDKPLSINVSHFRITIYSLYEAIDNEFQRSFLKLDGSNSHWPGKDEFRIAFCHWGDEYMLLPSPKVVRTAERLRRKGFDAVVGHHSHSSQSVSVNSDGSIVAYSLGNFNFPDPLWSKDPEWFMARIGYMLSIQLNSGGISWQRHCCLMDEWGVPELLSSKSAHNYFRDLDKISSKYILLNDLLLNLVYLRHSSRLFLKSNVLFGWFPRIKKGGLRQVWLFVLWAVNYRQILRYPFVFLTRDRLWRRYSRFLREKADSMES
jgi:hypothetical protein